MSHKPKRQRKLKKFLVDIESVTVAKGCNYINWINAAKRSLKERESKLLMIRVSTIQSIINTSFNLNYKVPSAIIESILNKSLYPLISKWKGINVSRVKKPLNTFKEYFAVARNWWDNHKQQHIATKFWIPLFADIQKVVIPCLFEFAHFMQNTYNDTYICICKNVIDVL